MAIREIYFLIQTPLTQRDYDRFGVERLKANGFDVWFLDFTGWLNSQIISRNLTRPVAYSQTVEIRTRKDLGQFFENRSGGDLLLIDLYGHSSFSSLIHKYVRRHKISYAVFCTNSIPRARYHPKGCVFVSREFWRRVLNFSRRKIIARLRAPAADVILAGGGSDQRGFPKFNGHTKVIWAHTLDYDLYLHRERQRPPPLVEGQYAVFLDEYFPLHPDFFVRGVRENPFKDPEEYYTEINEIFRLLESKLAMPIVIAQHPRTPPVAPNRFDGRRAFQGRTIDLVADSQLVLTHGSTSVNFAVLYQKPVLFVLPKKVRGGYYDDFITSFAGEFNKTPWEIDTIEKMDLQNELRVDAEIYGRYKENYIKRPNTPERFFWDIVAEAL